MGTETFKKGLTIIIIIMCINLEQKLYVQICALFTLSGIGKKLFLCQDVLVYRSVASA